MNLKNIEELYADEQSCAEHVGLKYVTDTQPGFTRTRQGKKFIYQNLFNETIHSNRTFERLEKLAIPPAWDKVWICKHVSGHLQATGYDEKGRKQYLYHPKWQSVRRLLNAYRLIVFGGLLPSVRLQLYNDINQKQLHRTKAIATVLAVMDKTFIRIGNEKSSHVSKTFGLTTMEDRHLRVDDDTIEFVFKGKGGKKQDKSFSNKKLAKNLMEMRDLPGEHLFEYFNDGNQIEIVHSGDVNEYLKELTSHLITAKEFRTWGGTLSAFNFAVDFYTQAQKGKFPLAQMYQTAADILGNTPGMCRDHYIHPDLIRVIKENHFDDLYQKISPASPEKYFSTPEAMLLSFLKNLLKDVSHFN